MEEHISLDVYASRDAPQLILGGGVGREAANEAVAPAGILARLNTWLQGLLNQLTAAGGAVPALAGLSPRMQHRSR